MEPLWMCRVCMAEDARMHPIAYTHLQCTYESLTSKPLETEDKRPMFVCYICYARLENCYQLRKACLYSETLFTQILGRYNPLFLPNERGIGERLEIVHPVIQLSLTGSTPTEDPVAKNSFPGNVEVILLEELAGSHASQADPRVHVEFGIDQGINAHKKQRLRTQKTKETLDDELTPTAAEQLGTNTSTSIDNKQNAAKPLERSSNDIDVVEEKSDEKELKHLSCIKDNRDVKLNNQRKIQKTVRFNIKENESDIKTLAKKSTNSNKLLDGENCEETTTAAKRHEVSLTDNEQIADNEFVTNSNTSDNKFEINSNTLLNDEQIAAKQRSAQKTSIIFIDDEQISTAAKHLERNSTTLVDSEQIVAKKLEIKSNVTKVKKTVRFNIEEKKLDRITSAKKFATNSSILRGSELNTTAAKPPEVPLNILIDNEQVAGNEFETNSNTLSNNEKIAVNEFERNSDTFIDAEETPTAVNEPEVKLNTLIDTEQIAAKQLGKISNTLIDNEQIAVKPLEMNSNKSTIKKTVKIIIEHNEQIAAQQLKINSNTIDDEQIAAKQIETSSNISIENEQTPATVEELATNSNNNVEEIVYQCKVCNKYCTYPSDLRNHERTHTGEKPYQCDVCETCFSTKFNLKKHMQTVHMGITIPTKPRRNQKKITRKTATDNGKIKNKKAPVKNGDNENECKVCKKSFRSKPNLRRHGLTHTDKKPYQCDICDKFFRSSSSLRVHILAHGGVKRYQCSVCKKFFKYKSNLTNHVLSKHSNMKPYQCDICKKRYTRVALVGHLRTHTDEKPFQCNVCKRSFNYKSHLNTHMRKHTGEKPFQCHICKKFFSKNNNLKAHLRLRICKKPD